MCLGQENLQGVVEGGPHVEDDKMKWSRAAPHCDLLEGGAAQPSRGPMWSPLVQDPPHTHTLITSAE